ncbi:MAG: hypothetical protein WDM71_08040 [Ferruginibacter sp.]
MEQLDLKVIVLTSVKRMFPYPKEGSIMSTTGEIPSNKNELSLSGFRQPPKQFDLTINFYSENGSLVKTSNYNDKSLSVNYGLKMSLHSDYKRYVIALNPNTIRSSEELVFDLEFN